MILNYLPKTLDVVEPIKLSFLHEEVLPKLLLCHITKEEKIAVEEEKRWRIVKKKTKTMSMKKKTTRNKKMVEQREMNKKNEFVEKDQGEKRI